MFDIVPSHAIERGDSALWDQDKLTKQEEIEYRAIMKY